MMDALPFDLELPARRFAQAFLNVSMVSGDDESAPLLYRSVCWEVYGEDRVRFVATDTSALLTSAIDGEWEIDVPELDEAPVCSIVAGDVDQRLASLCQYLLKLTKKEQEEASEPLTVKVTSESVESDDEPTLAPEMNRRVLVVDAGFERVQLPIVDGVFPNWRALWPTSGPKRTESLAMNPYYLGVLAKLRPAGSSVELSFGGKTAPVVVTYQPVDAPQVSGLVMPVRAS